MITRETLTELLGVLNVQASHPQTLEQCAYIDGMRIMLEMVMTEHYREPGCIVYMQRQGWGEYVFIDEEGNEHAAPHGANW